MKRFSFLALLVVALPALYIACGDDDDGINDSPPQPADTIAVIYDSDAAWATGWEEALVAAGYEPLTIAVGDITTTDLSSASLFLVGPAIGSSYDFGDDAAVAAIGAVGAPILGMGPGGARLFQELGYSHNWGHCWSLSSCSDPACVAMQVMMPSHEFFGGSTPIMLPIDSILSVYTATGAVAAYSPSLSDSTTLIGRQVGDATHYVLTSEGKTVLWGFSGSHSDMNGAGQALAINIIRTMLTWD